MSLTKSVPGSNAPNASGDTGTTSTGNVGRDGYLAVDQPKQKPAQENQDLSNLHDFKASLGNDGTNMGSYEEQPEELDAESGD
jgi:hypothetical protein